MKRLIIIAAALLVMASPAWAAGFVNGGFETGDWSGWNQGSGYWTGGWPINPATYSPGLYPSYWEGTIVAPGVDPISGKNTVYNGNYAARINNNVNNYSVGTINQTVLGYSDSDMYFEWAAVLEASHGPTDSDNFTLTLRDLTVGDLLINRAYNSATNGPIFTAVNAPAPIYGTWYYTDWQVEHIDLASLGRVGHNFELSLLAADCPYSGHAGYVYLDGFAPTVVPEGPGDSVVPEPASLSLLGLGLLGLLRRRK